MSEIKNVLILSPDIDINPTTSLHNISSHQEKTRQLLVITTDQLKVLLLFFNFYRVSVCPQSHARPNERTCSELQLPENTYNGLATGSILEGGS